MTFERGAAVVGVIGLVFWIGYAAGFADPEHPTQACVHVDTAIERAQAQLDGKRPCEGR